MVRHGAADGAHDRCNQRDNRHQKPRHSRAELPGVLEIKGHDNIVCPNGDKGCQHGKKIQGKHLVLEDADGYQRIVHPLFNHNK
ncbi:hypothetical protein SDC9_113535 [bioreactor metagenome]|uniref:Uncharacterized protein n=1 Tax=bioreactor metagenome TaxID=1076179 RepID=A0A645BMZ9_9ZZZZ